MKVRIKKDVLGDAETQTVFGQTAKAGDYVEVSDNLADKIKGNPTLEAQGKLPEPDRDDDDDAAPRRRGRPPAAA